MTDSSPAPPSKPSASPERPPAATLTMASGGWVLVAMVIVCAALLIWALASVWSGQRPVGDGVSIESYGFDLDPLLVTTDGTLVSSGNPRDFLQTLDEPTCSPGREVAEINRRERGKFLVPTDRVVGVVVNGAARAYPLRVLNAHEVVNDVLGDEPIVIVYSPLGDSATVHSRRLGDRAPEFGVSGLLLNSNTVIYDRVATGAAPSIAASLWSPLEDRAIAGPAAAAGERLTPIPGVQVMAWSDWLARHPDTDVVRVDPEMAKRTKKFDYRRYWSRGELKFPVDPLPTKERGRDFDGGPDGDGPSLMAPVVAVDTGSSRVVYPLAVIARRAATGPWAISQDDVELTFTWHDASETVEISWPDGSEAPRTVQALWYAWHAAHPADRVAD